MDEILKMAADSGMTKQQGEEATGGIFALVKKNISPEQYKQITSKIPQIDTLVNKEESGSTDRAGAGGSVMSSLTSMASGGSGGAGSNGGGGNTAALTALIGICGKYGISAKQVNAFLPQLVSLVKKECGVDIGSMLGLPSGSATSTGGTAGGSQPAGGGGDAVSGMMSSAMGMFGKK
mmetsp:Transcript_23816/g.43238  ORF Transcript_23816/g.43238 Transcript_23816/m.43238 type:complete len:178 (-) Transcript_23816:200-733(-)